MLTNKGYCDDEILEVGGWVPLLEDVSASQEDWGGGSLSFPSAMCTGQPGPTARCTAPFSEHARGMRLAHLGPAASGLLLGTHRSAESCACPSLFPTELDSEGQLGRMPMQGTNGQAHGQLQEAVVCAPGRAAGQPASDMGTWRVETGGGSPAALGQAHGLPLAARAGRGPHLPSLGLGSLLPLSGSRLLPAQLFAAECTLLAMTPM